MLNQSTVMFSEILSQGLQVLQTTKDDTARLFNHCPTLFLPFLTDCLAVSKYSRQHFLLIVILYQDDPLMVKNMVLRGSVVLI